MRNSIQVCGLFSRRTWSALVLVIAHLTGHAALAAELVEVFTEPYRVIQVAAAEPGLVATVEVKQGERVEAGAAIATLDRDVLLSTLEVAKLRAKATAARRRAEAELRVRSRHLEKLESLHQRGHASEEEMESAKANVEIAQAALLEVDEQLELAQLQVQEIEAQLQRRTIRSPIRGEVIQLHKDVGEYVAITEPLVATVVQLNKLRVKFYVGTERARRMVPGNQVALSFPDSNQRCVGTVEFVSPTTNADSRTVRIEVAIDNRQGKYRSGVPVSLAPEDLLGSRRGGGSAHRR